MTEPIFLVGAFSPDRAEASFLRGFEAFGARTITLDTRDPQCQLSGVVRNRIGYRLTMNSLAARRAASRQFNRHLQRAVLESGASAVLVLKGEFVMPETLQALRREGVKVGLFYPDNPFPPHSCQRPETLPAALETDLYLIWSERLVEELRRAGVRKPAFLPFAWDAQVFPYMEAEPQGTWPGALFLGGWDKEREEFLEELAALIPVRIYGPREWGARTRAASRVRQCWQGSDLRMADAARAVRQAAVCVNPLRRQHTIGGQADGLIMRHFEVPGAGGVLLSTRGTGATAIFPEGQTGDYFAGPAECAEKARMYMADQAVRMQFAARAHAAVAGAHQYKHRAAEIVRLFQECR